MFKFLGYSYFCAMNFGGLKKKYGRFHTSRIVLLPVPYDEPGSRIKGADKGPKALLEASANMELFDIETDFEVYKHGIYTSNPILVNNSPDKMVDAVYKKTFNYIEEEKFIVTIGGDHSVSIGTIKAHAEKFQELTVLQIDAHANLRPEYEGSEYNHACVMARVKEWCPFVQVGIRSMDQIETDYVVPEKIFYAKDIHQNNTWMEKAIMQLTDSVYLTFDLDGLDPSVLPSTGTPEPGGLEWYQTLEFLKKVIAHRNLVGFDVVGLCPSETHRASDYLAANLVYKILSYAFKERKL
jgi:agmatinase